MSTSHGRPGLPAARGAGGALSWSRRGGFWCFRPPDSRTLWDLATQSQKVSMLALPGQLPALETDSPTVPKLRKLRSLPGAPGGISSGFLHLAPRGCPRPPVCPVGNTASPWLPFGHLLPLRRFSWFHPPTWPLRTTSPLSARTPTCTACRCPHVDTGGGRSSVAGHPHPRRPKPLVRARP